MKYKVDFLVYNVKNRLEESGLPEEYTDTIDTNWYEYEVSLINEDNNEISNWDSYVETYNGLQKLTYEQAINAAQKIKDDIEKNNVDVKLWFSF